MNLDHVQYVFMFTVFPIAVIAITSSLQVSSAARIRIALGLSLWFGFTYLATVPNVGRVPGALFGIIFPVVIVSAYMLLNRTARIVIVQMSLAPLVALHVTRIAGGLFILLFWEGRLSNPFAYIAGGGDLLSAALAIPAVIIAYRGKPGWERWLLAWNLIGFSDFIVAITLGMTSQPGSPFQIFNDLPGTSVLGEMPWRFIPSYFVPLYMMIHVALFIRLVTHFPSESRNLVPAPPSDIRSGLTRK
jgi:hypothetical protein